MFPKEYQKQTLNGNWLEERAEGLKGVIADYGNRETGTTYGESFQNAPPHSTLSAAQKKKLMADKGKLSQVRMTSLDTYSGVQKSVDVDIPSDFKNTINGFKERKSSGEKSETYITTSQAAFQGHGTFNSNETTERPAGGCGSRRPEKGIQTSGAIGEVVKYAKDPKNDTAAQRTWLYDTDPMFKTPEVISIRMMATHINLNKLEKDSLRTKDTSSVSDCICEDGGKGYKRVSSSITKPNNAVWGDD